MPPRFSLGILGSGERLTEKTSQLGSIAQQKRLCNTARHIIRNKCVGGEATVMVAIVEDVGDDDIAGVGDALGGGGDVFGEELFDDGFEGRAGV